MISEDFFVSTIIPVYNEERLLAEAIESVLQQNYQPLEIIVIDDGSTDTTAQVADQYQDRIRYVYQPNSGPSAARNRGIKMAKGNLIAFLDADDLWSEDKLKMQITYLLEHPLVEIVQGLIQQMQLITSPKREKLEFEALFQPYDFINLGSAIYKKSVFEKVGLFDETLVDNEDTDWYFRAWEQGINKVVINQVTLFYRKHDRNLTNQQDLVHFGFTKLLKKHLDRRRRHASLSVAQPKGFPKFSDYFGNPPSHHPELAVKDKDITFISNDCWCTDAYYHLSIKYRTPLIGTRIFAPCYIKMLKNLKFYLESPLNFIEFSQYDFMNQERKKRFFPIALLNDDVEIHFYHEEDEQAAKDKWERRLKRINWNNLYIKFSEDPQACKIEHLEEFEKLEFPYKVCFTLKEYPHLRSTIKIEDYFDIGAPMYHLSKRYFNVVSWLNKELGSNTQAYRL